jgi:hypothetical protein
MKRLTLVALLLGACLTGLPALAQEHFTEGPVWEVSYYRTKPGKFDDYMKYLRANFLVTTVEEKKQGLILDAKILLNTPRDANDWDIAIATLYTSFGKALDFNQSDEDKLKAIAEKHYKTKDEAKQRDMSAPRFQMRDYIGTRYLREVTLKPLP